MYTKLFIIYQPRTNHHTNASLNISPTQVNDTTFASTQDNTTFPELTQIFVDIQAEFGIVWTDVTWEQLSVPLYSGLACRILLVIIGQPIPVTVELQAVYWTTYINVQGDVNVFINVVIIIINGAYAYVQGGYHLSIMKNLLHILFGYMDIWETFKEDVCTGCIKFVFCKTMQG